MMCFGTSLANDVTADLLEKYQEMQYSTEAGITKGDYRKQYRELYIATQKAQGKIPQETYDKFSSALRSYNNAITVWDIQRHTFSFDDISSYIEDHDRFKRDVSSNIWGQYDRGDIVIFLFTEGNTKVKKLMETQKESK